MSIDLSEVTRDALTLPDDQRARLAQLLWESLSAAERGPTSADFTDAVDRAAERDAELTSGGVASQSHDEAMREAREAIQ